jgi:hypothetical protein
MRGLALAEVLVYPLQATTSPAPTTPSATKPASAPALSSRALLASSFAVVRGRRAEDGRPFSFVCEDQPPFVGAYSAPLDRPLVRPLDRLFDRPLETRLGDDDDETAPNGDARGGRRGGDGRDSGWWIKAPLEEEAPAPPQPSAAAAFWASRQPRRSQGQGPSAGVGPVVGQQRPPPPQPQQAQARVYLCTRGHQQFDYQETWTSITVASGK